MTPIRRPNREEQAARLGGAVQSSDRVRAALLERAGLLHRAKANVLAQTVARLEKRSADADRLTEARARLDAHRAQIAPLQHEIARAQIAAATVTLGRDALLVHGRVLDDQRAGVAGLTVAVLADGREVTSYTGTDARGYFEIMIKQAQEEDTSRILSVQISNEARAVLYREKQPTAVLFGQTRYVEIVLGDADRRGIAPPPGAADPTKPAA
jgi:hypothetical protein